MELIYLLLFLWLLCISVTLQLVVFHPVSFVFYGIRDFYNFIIHKNWRLSEGGQLNSYNAHFGGGKTLTMAHDITKLYGKKNNKRVWCRSRKKFVTQKIHVLANFKLEFVPYEPLESLAQVVNCAELNKQIDMENDTRTVTYVLMDEASVQLNSRNFKTNIDALFLNTLLTCRHYHINLWYSSQKFKLTDALMRSVTQRCIECKKVWRFMFLTEYNADEIEYASDPTMVKPIRRYGYFIKDRDYASYDTLATVGNLKKAVEKGDMMSEQEILELRGQINPDNDAITNRSWKLKTRKKR